MSQQNTQPKKILISTEVDSLFTDHPLYLRAFLKAHRKALNLGDALTPETLHTIFNEELTYCELSLTAIIAISDWIVADCTRKLPKQQATETSVIAPNQQAIEENRTALATVKPSLLVTNPVSAFLIADKLTPMLAKTYTSDINTNGWLMSEKLDGVRAIWNGTNLVTRNNNLIHAPRWFTDSLPKDTVLDGELWLGRGGFQKTVSIVRSHNGDWTNIKFRVFDLIQQGDYTSRYHALNALTLPEHVTVLEQITCTSQEDLDHFEQSILNQGGEGVMIRNPAAEYEQKRSANLLKIKRYQDAEVTIISTEQGTGRNTGLIGALVARFNGRFFNIGAGLSDQDRAQPASYWLNKTVTFSFFGLTDNGIPRHPAFIGIRDYE